MDEFYAHLTREGFHPWMDKYELKGGQNWDFELKKALKRSDIIVVFLSNNSVDKRGYCQREIKIALTKAQEKLMGDIFIIPVALDADLRTPDELEDIHVIKTDRVDGFTELSRSIAAQLNELGEHQTKIEETTGLRWSVESVSENWDGLPGFDLRYDILRLSSVDFPEVSRVTEIMRGDAVSQLLAERRIKFEQSPDHFNFGQDRFARQNSCEVSCQAPIVTERVMSIVQEISSWWAGAAHPNHGFSTMNFILDPLVKLDRIQDIFDDDDNAFSAVQKLVRRKLLEAEYEGEKILEERSVVEGTSDWENFDDFAFTPDGLMILFGPYAVGPYAAGSHVAVVPYEEIAGLLKREIAAALGIDYLARKAREVAGR